MTNPSDPAFPNKDHMGDGPDGLSKREEFAKAAMQGIMANATTYFTIAEALTKHDPEKASQVVASLALLQADALIKELSK